MSQSDWDIEEYKTDYESEEHWELRKKFMETYKDKFPEDELVCLAQVFINVEFMGCRYPEETMRLVGELSQEVASEFRKDREGRLKRTFVKASDAAEQKAKGTRLKNTNNKNTFNITAKLKATKLSDNSDSGEDEIRPSFSGVKKENRPSFQNNYWNALFYNNSNQDKIGGNPQAFFNTFKYKQNESSSVILFSGLKFGKFVLNITGDRSCLMVSAKRSGFKYEEKETELEENRICEIFLNKRLVGIGKGLTIKIAKKLAFETALKLLERECYSIKPKSTQEKINISRSNETITANIEISSANSKLDSNNIGYKMMQKQGWTGGALGVRSKGRVEPIDCLTVKNNRKGLGNTSDEINSQYFDNLLTSYKNSVDIRDLHFDSCFTKDERAKLHVVALGKNLKSTSYGKGLERYLVISKRMESAENILKEILINKNSMYMNKYEVRVPKSKRRDFPDHLEFESDDV